MLCLPTLALVLPFQGSDVRVSNIGQLRDAVSKSNPGTRILIEPGEYPGGSHFVGLKGEPTKPIVIEAANGSKPPEFVGGGNAIQLSSAQWVTLRNLKFRRQTGNGLNIDDGGNYKSPSKGVILEGLTVSELPAGNHDGIKLSGLHDFVVSKCRIENWGGSGIDMVGCASGVIRESSFRNGGDNAIQTKGGTRDVSIERCRFENFGQRGVNIGGSTGMPYFRPPIETVPAGRRFEAKNIWVQGCVFSGGTAPITFVGVDGATVRFNTIYHPERWAIRILQETRLPEFVPCRRGTIANNLIVFKSSQWSAGGMNIGPGTQPESFSFEGNLWFCSDRPSASKPSLPVRESNGIYGKDPLLADPESGSYGVRGGSPAAKVGAHAYSDK
jgi:hypothetical protein